jgi:hypothetical protein
MALAFIYINIPTPFQNFAERLLQPSTYNKRERVLDRLVIPQS